MAAAGPSYRAPLTLNLGYTGTRGRPLPRTLLVHLLLRRTPTDSYLLPLPEQSGGNVWFGGEPLVSCLRFNPVEQIFAFFFFFNRLSQWDLQYRLVPTGKVKVLRNSGGTGCLICLQSAEERLLLHKTALHLQVSWKMLSKVLLF